MITMGLLLNAMPRPRAMHRLVESKSEFRLMR